MREGNHAERGFTLIELMVVVAIIAILAMIVVPSFMASSTKAKRRSEASAMFAEIAAKQEAWKVEKTYYLGDPSGTNYVGTKSCPTSVPTADYVWSSQSCVTTAGTTFNWLRVTAPSQSMRCQYSITTGLAGVQWTPPTGFKNSQGVLNTIEPVPASGWYYIVAECDERGNGGTNAKYYMSSVDRKMQYQNEGT